MIYMSKFVQQIKWHRNCCLLCFTCLNLCDKCLVEFDECDVLPFMYFTIMLIPICQTFTTK